MNTRMTPVNISIIGCGAIAEQWHLPVLSEVPECKIVSLVDIDSERVQRLAQRYRVGHCSTTIDDLPSNVEAALVALPHHLHHSVSCDLMKRGLHVFCEKPMALTQADAETMVRCAEENKVRLNINQDRRFGWHNRQIKAIIDSKELGNLVEFRLHEGYLFNWSTVSGFFFEKEKSGGGVLIDMGAHVLDLLLWWLGDYPSAIEYRDDNFGGVEAECELNLQFGSSTRGSVKLSRLVNLQNGYAFTFERGTLTARFHKFVGKCDTITMEKDGKRQVLSADRIVSDGDYYRQVLQDFLVSVRTGKPSSIEARSIIPSIRLIEECYRNAKRLDLPWLCSTKTRQIAQEKKDLVTSKVLITGASGFIGGRIAESLYFDHNNIPVCLVKNMGRLARLARFPAHITRGDVLDYDSLLRATTGCDAVVHCAYGNTADDELNARITIEGTENVIRAALQNGVKKLVHLSTIEVYGDDQPALVNENTEPHLSRQIYGKSKLEAEKVCAKYFQEQRLSIIILRPAVVYGPYAPTWTIDVIKQLLNRGFCLSEETDGICNPVYVDDVVNAIFLAIEGENLSGEIFNISSGEKLTWNDYYGRYNQLLRLPPLERANKSKLWLYSMTRKVLDTGMNYLRTRYGSNVFRIYYKLLESGRIPNLGPLHQRGGLVRQADVLDRNTYYPIEKAAKALGFEPQYKLETGMILIAAWLAHSSMVDQVGALF